MLCLSGFELYSRWVPLFMWRRKKGQTFDFRVESRRAKEGGQKRFLRRGSEKKKMQLQLIVLYLQ